MDKKFLDIKDEVRLALSEGRPVVALESTIISHGMPYPKNKETAKLVEKTLRDKGVTPATIAIIDGRIKVGIDDEMLEFLATSKDILKVSRRDLPLVLAKKLNGATTVAATMIAAEAAGIKVFVTGGIGGVHRGAGVTHDISADLEELKNTNVAVVCAGVKSILDIPGTLEYLETAGVPVITYNADSFPAFYSRESGCKAELRLDTPKEIADLIRVKDEAGLKGGVLVGCPVPKEYEIPFEKMDGVIKEALKDCEDKGITGKRITPFVLNRVKELTDGESLEANIRLVVNNAALGAEIAKEI